VAAAEVEMRANSEFGPKQRRGRSVRGGTVGRAWRGLGEPAVNARVLGDGLI
jgi:hypothetical protein